jgi:hypothetical protein
MVRTGPAPQAARGGHFRARVRVSSEPGGYALDELHAAGEDRIDREAGARHAVHEDAGAAADREAAFRHRGG